MKFQPTLIVSNYKSFPIELLEEHFLFNKKILRIKISWRLMVHDPVFFDDLSVGDTLIVFQKQLQRPKLSNLDGSMIRSHFT